MKTIYLNNELINIGEWEYKIIEGVATNPLPEGSVEKDEEVLIDSEGGKYIAPNQ
jgi:hypothetical protein